MPLCSSCGSQIDGSASFCTGCGKRMPAVAPSTSEVGPAFCTSCANKLTPDTSFCTSCGQPVSAGPQPVPAAQPVVAEPRAEQPAIQPTPTASSQSAAAAPAPVQEPAAL